MPLQWISSTIKGDASRWRQDGQFQETKNHCNRWSATVPHRALFKANDVFDEKACGTKRSGQHDTFAQHNILSCWNLFPQQSYMQWIAHLPNKHIFLKKGLYLRWGHHTGYCIFSIFRVALCLKIRAMIKKKLTVMTHDCTQLARCATKNVSRKKLSICQSPYVAQMTTEGPGHLSPRRLLPPLALVKRPQAPRVSWREAQPWGKSSVEHSFYSGLVEDF